MEPVALVRRDVNYRQVHCVELLGHLNLNYHVVLQKSAKISSGC